MDQEYLPAVKYVGTCLPLPIHKELKTLAESNGLSLTSFLRDALVEKLQRHNKPKTRRRKTNA